MKKRKIIAYISIAILIAVFGLSTWLASNGQFFEAIAVVGVATTLGWFAIPMVSVKNEDKESSE